MEVTPNCWFVVWEFSTHFGGTWDESFMQFWPKNIRFELKILILLKILKNSNKILRKLQKYIENTQNLTKIGKLCNLTIQKLNENLKTLKLNNSKT